MADNQKSTEFNLYEEHQKLVQFHVAKSGFVFKRNKKKVIRECLLVKDSYIIGSSDADATILLGGEAGCLMEHLNSTIKISPRVALYGDVSPCHAELKKAGNTWVITDLGSESGTFLNDRKLSPDEATIIRERKDAFRIGNSTFRIETSKPFPDDRGRDPDPRPDLDWVLQGFCYYRCSSCNDYPVPLPPCIICGRKEYMFRYNGNAGVWELACCHCPTRHPSFLCACGCPIVAGRFVFTDVVRDIDHCFIATELYGPQSTQVMLLRTWRDERLLTNRLGRLFVCVYYRVSPSVVRVIRRSPTLRRILRAAVESVIFMLLRKQETSKDC